MNASVNFRVAGGELSSYIDQIQKKSENLTNSAIKSAMEQSNASKEQLKIINEQIAAIERKNRMESQAARSIALERKEVLEKEVREKFEAKRRHFDENNEHLSEKDRRESNAAINNEEREELNAIRNSFKDQLNVLREEEKQNKLQTQLQREAVQTAKEAAREQVAAIRSGDKTLADVYREVGSEPSEEEKLTLRMIEEQLEEEKRKEEKEKKGKESVFGSLLAVDNINRLISSAGQFTQTQNGFDLIQPASNMAGRVIGGIIGGLVGSLAGGVGAVGGASLGASIGGGFGDVVGAFEQREALTKENFFKARNRYRGITGLNTDGMDMPDMMNAGISATQFLQLQGEYARKRGSRGDAATTARDAIYAEKAFGVDQGTSSTLIELQRSSKESNRELASLIGGVLERGQGSIFKNGDNTFLNEFLGKFASLQKELLKNSNNVASGLTMDILKQFNSMGGMFDAKDPRSAGLITSINNSLSNPSSDNMKALAFGVLRDQNPHAGIFDLREQMQKGLASPEYLKGMLGMIDRMGGDDQMKMNNLSGMFQGVPFSAIRTLFQNRKNLKNFDTSELRSIGISDEVLKGKAEENTTDLEKNAAKIENGILGGEAVSKMADAFVTAIKAMLGGAVINLNNGQGNITIMSKQAVVQQNETKKAADNAKGQATIQQQTDMHSTYRTGF
jgi:hypothetical protein